MVRKKASAYIAMPNRENYSSRMHFNRVSVVTLALSTMVACGQSAGEGSDEGSPTMRPGEDCTHCHGNFTVAGSVFPTANAATNQGVAGVVVTLVDANGKSIALTSNSAGNFYTSEAVQFPADVTVVTGTTTQTMPAAPNGSCNSCHTLPPQSNAPGRVHAP